MLTTHPPTLSVVQIQNDEHIIDYNENVRAWNVTTEPPTHPPFCDSSEIFQIISLTYVYIYIYIYIYVYFYLIYTLP